MDLSKPFEVNDFVDAALLLGSDEYFYWDPIDTPEATVTFRSDGCPYDLVLTPKGALNLLIGVLNMLRELYLKTSNSMYKSQIYVLLPRSYKGKAELAKAASEMAKKIAEDKEKLSKCPQLQKLYS